MSKQFTKVYSGDTFAVLMRAVHDDLLVSDPYYRAEYDKAQQEKRDATTPPKRG
jgi:hypothetical protein